MGGGISGSYSEFKTLVIPGFHLPEDKIFTDGQNVKLLLDINLRTQKEILDFQNKASASIADVNGKSKAVSGAFIKLHDVFIQENVKYRELLPENYQFFGNNNNTENLKVFLKLNSFYASALIVKKDPEGVVTYEINSFEEGEKVTWFSRLVAAMTPQYIRVNAKFDANLNIISINSYKEKEILDKDVEYSCGALLFLLSFYGEVIHSTIHVLHYLMICGLADSVSHSTMLSAWAKPFYPNIHLTYVEVEKLLFAEGGALTGGLVQTDRTQILNLAKDMLTLWSACKTNTEFLSQFLLRDCLIYGRETLAKSDILTEFFKHADLVTPYATELCDEFALEIINGESSYRKCNANMAKFFDNVGGMEKLNTLQKWIELMSITGMIHGNTLSLSRLVLTQSIMSFASEKDVFDETDLSFLTIVSLTITGSQEDRHVFSSSLIDPKVKATFSPNLKHVLMKYDTACGDLKREFFFKIKSDPEDFSKFGWIYTDYCLDGVDGKQLTLTTYV